MRSQSFVGDLSPSASRIAPEMRQNCITKRHKSITHARSGLSPQLALQDNNGFQHTLVHIHLVLGEPYQKVGPCVD